MALEIRKAVAEESRLFFDWTVMAVGIRRAVLGEAWAWSLELGLLC